MVTVFFTDKEIADGERFQEKMNKIASKFKNRGIANVNYDKVGYLSELAFEKFLKHIGKEYGKDEVWGGSDRYDFLINGNRYDVKCSQKFKNKLVVNEKKLAKSKKNGTLLVGTYIDHKFSRCNIHGWCTHDDMMEDDNQWKGGRLYYCPFNKLTEFKYSGIIDN